MCQKDRSSLAKRMWNRRRITRNMIASHTNDLTLRLDFLETSDKMLKRFAAGETREPERIPFVTELLQALRELDFRKINRAIFNDMRSHYDTSKA